MKRALSYRVEGKEFPRNEHRATTRLRNTLAALGLPPDIIRRVAICLYEGESNMSIHAGGGQIHVLIESTAVTLLLQDDGPGIPRLDLAMENGYSTASTAARKQGFGAGLGLSNMRSFSDAFDIQTTPQGTTIQMKFHLPQ